MKKFLGSALLAGGLLVASATPVFANPPVPTTPASDLPHTGSSTGWLTAGGVVLLAVGASSSIMSRMKRH